jgi:CubicO group peptidase (beta-lactamase class C family)
MTKSFTALAVLKLRDAGRLRLDDAVAQHVPELRAWPLPSGDSAPITLRQLLSHTAGLPEDNPQGDRQLALSAQAFSDWLRGGVPLASAPGSAFEYSNLGFMILGRVVSNVSRRPFQDYIRDEILRPLGMRATHWSPAAVPQDRLALGYRPQGTGWVAEPLLDDGAGAAMGGLLTTPRDLARFVAAMLGAWPPRDGAEQAPALRRTLREMQTGLGHPELWLGRRLPGGPVGAAASSYGFGLGASVDCNWGREVQHSGGLPGFGSDMLWLPDHGVAVIVMANRTYAPVGGLTRDTLRLFKATGGLQPRQALPAAALRQAASAAAALVESWNDDTASALAADNLFLDEPRADRQAGVAAARADVGRCSVGALKAENPLRGTQRLDCEQGWIDIDLTLAPVRGAKIQHFKLSYGKPLQAGLREVVEQVAAAVTHGSRGLPLAPGADRNAVAAVLESTRVVYGSCKTGEVKTGDGQTQASLQLVCDRGGPLQLSVNLAQGRLDKLSLRPQTGAVCLP